ncbi:acetylornithine deacetylase [Neorhizobium alkalisoli]|uniref:Acetylornithine deacetylase n=1 Tax=Neorhizobium alkalisoli TaxID=528178 RepID=A0A561R847_9HYPH|nr:acetylornithine deacetylase [Neorhizobium alkalisoli]TWF58783.1 acetylornithine deacetylase [Neorhizobium alkalisoli]
MTATQDWLARLVSHPTVSADTNLPLIEEIEAALTKAGAVCERFYDATGQKASLLARIGPDAPGGLMLSGHVDVVPVAGQDWTVPPFELTEKNGRLYGRGTTDMKGFIASCLSLVETIDAKTLAAPLWLAISYDEEIGCVGVRPMLEEIAAREILPDLIVVGEPTSMQLGLGHKGKMAFHVKATGVPRHSAEAPLALNALHIASDFITGLRRLQDEIEARGPREDGYSVPYATVHVGKLTAGTAVNLVPDQAELLMECRMMAADDPLALAEQIRKAGAAAVAPHRERFREAAIDIEVTGNYPGHSVDGDHPVVQAFASCLPKASRECRVSFGTEAGLFAQALDVPVVICGPGSMDQGHRPDEFIEGSQLAICDNVLAAAVIRFCASRRPLASHVPKQMHGKM